MNALMSDALAEAAMRLMLMLEVDDPAELAIVERHASPAILAAALLMTEEDPEFAARWTAAGTDWAARGQVLHDAVMYLLTPERPEQHRAHREVAPETELERAAARG